MDNVRPIDANALGRYLSDWQMSLPGDNRPNWNDAAYDTLDDVLDVINKAPTIDPASLRPAAHWKPSVGEWVHVDDSGEVWSEPAVECSKCGGIISKSDHDSYVWNYCPVCGSKMEG